MLTNGDEQTEMKNKIRIKPDTNIITIFGLHRSLLVI